MIFAAALIAGCTENLEQFAVTPTSLEFDGEAGTQTVNVTASGTWALKINGGDTWLTTSKTYGKSSGSVTVSVTRNSPEKRSAEIVFSCSGQSVTVTVTQAAGNAEIEVETDKRKNLKLLREEIFYVISTERSKKEHGTCLE